MSQQEYKLYPVLPLRDMVAFPKMILPLYVGRESSVKALELSLSEHDSKILLVAQRNESIDNPTGSDLYETGVVARVLQTIKLQNSNVKILVEGIEQAAVAKFTSNDGAIIAEAAIIAFEEEDQEDSEIPALERSIRDSFEEYVRDNKRLNNNVLQAIRQVKGLLPLCNLVAVHLPISVERKQEILDAYSIKGKAEKTLSHVETERSYLKVAGKINDRLKRQIERNNREYWLTEQMKAIQREMGEDESKNEFQELSKQIKRTKLSKEAREKAEAERRKLKAMSPMSQEAGVIRAYLKQLLDLPWGEECAIQGDIAYAQRVLDEDHYGLEEAKVRILEHLAVTCRRMLGHFPDANKKSKKIKIKDKKSHGSIICLVGPPGVGKTSLAASMARATGREFVRVFLGGMRDEAEIRGHRRTYVGAGPGKIIQGLCKVKTCNPLFLLDEIDKMSSDFRGDPASALLEALDPDQNKHFSDHYLEVDYDLSSVMFVTTANSMDIPAPLLDRMEIIRIPGYTEDEKLQIGKKYLFPKQMEASGLRPEEMSIDDEAFMAIIRRYTYEAGVRQLSRNLNKIMRKTLKRIMLGEIETGIVTGANYSELLGVPKYNFGGIDEESQIGITNGLSYNQAGGDLLAIEAVVMPGKGEVKITGKLGDVMKESVLTAISYIRSKAKNFNIDPKVFQENDTHLHVPEGAVPKDGPSAGIAIATSIVSALTNTPVSHSVAMTGEITLRGRVLEIGGLKEKLLAALRGNVKTAIIPQSNLKDLEEIPDKVKNNLTIIPVSNASEVFKIAMPTATFGEQIITESGE